MKPDLCRFGLHSWSRCRGGWHACQREGCARAKACTWRCQGSEPRKWARLIGGLLAVALLIGGVAGLALLALRGAR